MKLCEEKQNKDLKMPAMKCANCGSSEIENDSTRADSVCTKCGTVCESGIIVSDVQFEENAHGGSSALGTKIFHFNSKEYYNGHSSNSPQLLTLCIILIIHHHHRKLYQSSSSSTMCANRKVSQINGNE